MGVKNFVKKIGDKAGNRVAQLSALSSSQVEKIQLARDRYLLEKPDPSDAAAVETTWKMMAASSVEIFNSYLPQLKDFYLPIEKKAEYSSEYDDKECEEFRPEHNIRYFNITKWVSDKKENSLEKLVNVYAVLANEECNIALVFNRTRSKTNVYLAVVNTGNADNNVDTNSYRKRLLEAVKGNFPGSELSFDDEKKGMGIIPCLDNDLPYSVATTSNIPTEKSEKFISQTIEKLLDGIIPEKKDEEYTIVLLATPILDVEERKTRLSEFYSGLKPYAEWETNYTHNETDSVSSTATLGVNIGASAGIQNGNSCSVTDSDSTQESSSLMNSENTSKQEGAGTSTGDSVNVATGDTSSSTITESRGTTDSLGESFTDTVGTNSSNTSGVNASVTVGTGENPFLSASGTVGVSTSNTVGVSTSTSAGTNSSHAENYSSAEAVGRSISNTISKGVTNTVSKNVSETVGTSVANTLGKAVTKSIAATTGVSKAVNFGGNVGANFARSSTITAMIGKNEGITQHFTNHGVKHALELLDNQMKRYELSSALGMWDFAAYILCEDPDIANNVAHTYLALTLGEESYMSKSAINLWKGNVRDETIMDTTGNKWYVSCERNIAKEIVSYVRELRHPLFALNGNLTVIDKAYNVYPPVVTATTSLTGKELAYSLNFPQKSISGLPIIECAEFGRNVVSYDNGADKHSDIDLGCIFHMNHVENSRVILSKESFASHAFVTGSTGSGKSNTVYQILNKARKRDVKFLVVEPAKGEYKNVFGNKSDVNVYSTNPYLSELLRINPFSFPDGIHIYEHMDRLVEIFNVCWPMYAAMPAVLKDAVEKAYEDCGWDLIKSINKYGKKYYPTFADVARNIKQIIDSSEYDAENKGAYKGSLLTRLQSLSNGINGLVFTTNEISSEDLFDRNVIVDLSRVGSSETKSLIMGMLVLKLQEYRMTSSEGLNNPLKHITVLEEAHNILKRTSTEQTQEGSNLIGKSVEMIANSIAEMRTYGEGFVIVDQAPGLMDMSVIRNTNTKIIMRLPDQTDRELVGKAANLNDIQIKELAKLPCGVGAVYQNEWIQPVLCKVDKVNTEDQKYWYDGVDAVEDLNSYDDAIYIADILSRGMKIDKDINRDDVMEKLSKLALSDYDVVNILKLMENPPVEPNMRRLAPIMNSLFPEVKNIIQQAYTNEADVTEWTNEAEEFLLKYTIDDQVRRDIIQGAITYYMIYDTNNREALENWIERGVLH